MTSANPDAVMIMTITLQYVWVCADAGKVHDLYKDEHV